MNIENNMVETNYGTAYAFFDCNASKEEIEGTIPTIRESVETPSELELSLTEDFEKLKGDVKLKHIIDEAKNSGMKYAIRANYPAATNKKTADELAAILNQAYQSPLYQSEEQFRGAIVYENKGEYIFRE